jgi:hypothetical protein
MPRDISGGGSCSGLRPPHLPGSLGEINCKCREQMGKMMAQQIFVSFGRGSCKQHGQMSTLGRSNSLAGATTCTPATPDHSATIGGHVGSAAGDLA